MYPDKAYGGIYEIFESLCAADGARKKPPDSLTASEGGNILVPSPDVMVTSAKDWLSRTEVKAFTAVWCGMLRGSSSVLRGLSSQALVEPHGVWRQGCMGLVICCIRGGTKVRSNPFLGFVWAVTACLEMKAHGLGHMFLGCNGFASYAQRVHWAMRDMLSLSAQNYKILGHSGLIFSKGQRQ